MHFAASFSPFSSLTPPMMPIRCACFLIAASFCYFRFALITPPYALRHLFSFAASMIFDSYSPLFIDCCRRLRCSTPFCCYATC